MWHDELYSTKKCPFRIDEDTLFIAFLASAELSCFHQLSWKEPFWICDLFAEAKCLDNGKATGEKPYSLVSTLKRYGIETMSASEKNANRDLAIRGFPFSPQERSLLMDYVKSDTDALDKLFPVLKNRIESVPECLLRGAYTKAVARSEFVGTPIDPQIHILKQLWTQKLPLLVAEIDKQYGVYNGLHFNYERFENYIDSQNISWDYTPSGLPITKRQYMSDQAKLYPQLEQLHELKKTVDEFTELKIAVSSDNKNRTMLSPWGSKTGRNQPSGNRFLWNCSKWTRFLVKPEKDYSFALMDFKSQEITIAGALSGDEEMLKTGLSEDPYIRMAIMAKMAPKGSSKTTHPAVRKQFKQLTLGTNYGMTVQRLAKDLDCTPAKAQALHDFHRRKFRKYWEWVNEEESYGLLKGYLVTNFGWKIHLVDEYISIDDRVCRVKEPNLRMMQNYHVQAHASHCLQITMMMCWEQGITVSCPIHDAVGIYAPTERIEEDIEKTKAIMREACRIVIGYEIEADVQRVDWPNRFQEESEGAKAMWNKILSLVPQIKA